MAIKKHDKHSGRKIVTRGKVTNRVLMKVLKGGFIQGHESLLQSRWALALDWDRRVVGFCEEPKREIILGGGKPFQYFPDFEVIRDDGSIDFIEIKPFSQSIKPKILRKHERIGEHFNSQGYGFRVLTEKELPQDTIVISNMRRFKWFALCSKSSLEKLQEFTPSFPTTFGELEEKVGSQQIVMEMLGHQLAYVDLSKPVTSLTEIRNIKEQDYANYY